jgi:dTDP-4-dehydrorhamnose reductase
MKVLLIGGSGQLGREIAQRWTSDEIVAPSHSEMPVEETSAINAAIERARPDIVVNCAAFHNVDVCEKEPDRAFAINALAVDATAALCEKHAIVFATISTDYVFDGDRERPYTENDCPQPISAYGASKRAGESLVLRREMKAFVVRTCGVYGKFFSKSKGYTFIDRIINQARSGEPIRVVNDVVASPTYAGHLAQALRALVETNAYGLYHACNAGPVSWYDFAAKALDLAGLSARIEPISASQWKTPARRPAFSALANDKLQSVGISMPRWDEGVAAYLRDTSP